MILNDKQIKKLAEEGMITPFVDKSVSNGISMGLQSYGYDISTGSEFKIFWIYNFRINISKYFKF